jgi:hypothetical protein
MRRRQARRRTQKKQRKSSSLIISCASWTRGIRQSPRLRLCGSSGLKSLRGRTHLVNVSTRLSLQGETSFTPWSHTLSKMFSYGSFCWGRSSFYGSLVGSSWARCVGFDAALQVRVGSSSSGEKRSGNPSSPSPSQPSYSSGAVFALRRSISLWRNSSGSGSLGPISLERLMADQ